jgi:nucleotide-binding universal stress UspA family protein
LAEKRLDATGNELDMGYSRIRASSTDPIKSCLDHLEAEDVDLIVLAVRQREGMMRWLGKMVGERISEGSKQPTLFLPTGRSGFVSAANGSVTLKNILIPIVKKPRAEPSVAFVRKLIRSLDVVTGSVSLLHVGTSETMPFVQYPMSNGWTWNRIRLEGERTETIVQFAKDIDANLIVMTTDGPDRFLDGLRGTTSERVLRKAHCPVAVLPVESVIE